jgi:hypothetical protein
MVTTAHKSLIFSLLTPSLQSNTRAINPYGPNASSHSQPPLPPPVPVHAALPSQPSLKRTVDNSPAWLAASNRQRAVKFENESTSGAPANATTEHSVSDLDNPLFVITTGIYNMSAGMRRAPIKTDNQLPCVVLLFKSKEVTARFRVHIDSCASLNVGNLGVHQWIMTTYPDIVEEYIQFDDPNAFHPIHLRVATNAPDDSVKASIDQHGALTAIVRYRTAFSFGDSTPFILSFALGADVAVNAIMGLPDIKALGGVLDFNSNTFKCSNLNTTFPLHGNLADTGIPSSVNFDPSKFIRPKGSSAATFPVATANGSPTV